MSVVDSKKQNNLRKQSFLGLRGGINMERFIVKIKIQLKNYEEFDKKLIEFLEANTIDYDLSVIQVMTKEEKKEVVDSIRKAMKEG